MKTNTKIIFANLYFREYLQVHILVTINMNIFYSNILMKRKSKYLQMRKLSVTI